MTSENNTGETASSEVAKPLPDLPSARAHSRPWRDPPPRSNKYPPILANQPVIPPNYQRHLRALIAQAAAQVSCSTESGSAGGHLVEWDSIRRDKWVEAIWRVVEGDKLARKGLMDEPIAEWVVGIAKRRDLWKARARTTATSTPAMSPAPSQTQRLKLSALTPANRPSTPNHGSGASSAKRPASPADGAVDSLLGDGEAFKDRLKSMAGYVPYEGHDWDVTEWAEVEDEFSQAKAPRATIPGAFPHTDAYTYKASPSPSATSVSREPTEAISSPTTPASLAQGPVKVVYCTYVPPSSPPQQQLPAHTESMYGHPPQGRKSSENVGSFNRSGSPKILAGLVSTSTLLSGSGQNNTAFPDDVKIEYWPGRFALGTHDTEAMESDVNEGLAVPLSGTQNAPRKQSHAISTIIAGAEDDLVAGEQARLVGGTFVLRGLSADDAFRRKEFIAVEKVLRVMIYSLHAMRFELALFDALGVPRELAPLPERLESPTSPSSGQPEGIESKKPGPLRSTKKSTKGFFSKLGGNSKSILSGWLLRKDQKEAPVEVISCIPTGETIPAVTTEPRKGSENPKLGTPEEEGPRNTSSHSITLSSYERQIQTLDRLRKLKLSITPGLTFPMPPLLLRIAAENQPGHIAPWGPLPEDQGSPRETLLHKPRTAGYRLGGDIKAGLNAIWPHSETYEGWIRLQGLDLLHSITRLTGLERNVHGDHEMVSSVCQQPQILSIRYYDPTKDDTLGQKLDAFFATTPDSVCGILECEGDISDHEQSWTHAGVRIILQTRTVAQDPALENSEKIADDETWVECEKCGARSNVQCLDGVARLFSWGQLLELLLYHHESIAAPTICPHTQAPRSWMFRRLTTIIRLSRESVKVLETRMPKLQIGPNVSKRKPGVDAAAQAVDSLLDPQETAELIEVTRREIEAFYVSLERLVAKLRDEVLPSMGSEHWTELLDDLTAASRKEEFALYDSLSRARPGQINDVRRKFVRRICAARLRLQKLRSDMETDPSENWLALVEPQYSTDSTLHPLPGSFVLVRDNEPSSIIAYTLSSLQYHVELARSAASVTAANIESNGYQPTDAPDQNPENPINTAETQGLAMPIVIGGESDDENDAGDLYHWSCDVQRLDSPRDLSLLGIRSLAKKKSDGAVSLGPRLKTPLAPKPQAPASIEITLEQVEGRAQPSNILGDLVKTISRATAGEHDVSVTTSSADVFSPTTSTPGSEVNLSGKSKRALPTSPGHSRSPRTEVRRPRQTFDSSQMPRGSSPDVPPSAFRSLRVIEPTLPVSPPGSPSQNSLENSSTLGERWSTAVTSTVSNSFNQLVNLGVSVGDSLVGSLNFRSSSGDEGRSLSSLIGPLGILSNMDNSMSTFDEKPHISFSYEIGSQFKATCTVFYATAFDSLRRRCAVDKSFVASLSRTSDWDAQGGKSKACFFKTSDDRYIVKELVSKWGASDTHALLEIAPSYFVHLANSQNRASSLAKIVGFYSVKIQDTIGGNTRRTLDLLVMENLFHQQKISRTFDLKGIEGRRVPVKSNPDNGIAPSTLFDGDWLEGQRKSPVFLQPHSKRILREAIAGDAAYLANQSIMDYSLLVGLDEVRGELVTGIVDAIGSYNLLKTLESRSKLALNRGGDVTVIPPDQYRERFESALKQYFIACPDKWSRTPSTSNNRDAALVARDILPSVV